MNPTEQKERRTAVTNLQDQIDAMDVAFTIALDERTSATLRSLEMLRENINAERTHRLKLADEQRAYVDGLNILHNTRIHVMSDRIDTFRSRGFWSRLNWLVTGR